MLTDDIPQRRSAGPIRPGPSAAGESAEGPIHVYQQHVKQRGWIIGRPCECRNPSPSTQLPKAHPAGYDEKERLDVSWTAERVSVVTVTDGWLPDGPVASRAAKVRRGGDQTGTALRRVTKLFMRRWGRNAVMPQVHKGPRKQITATRVHPDVFDRVQAEAVRLGTSKSDVVAHVLCKEFGLPELSPLRGIDEQSQTQMPMTA